MGWRAVHCQTMREESSRERAVNPNNAVGRIGRGRALWPGLFPRPFGSPAVRRGRGRFVDGNLARQSLRAPRFRRKVRRGQQHRLQAQPGWLPANRHVHLRQRSHALPPWRGGRFRQSHDGFDLEQPSAQSFGDNPRRRLQLLLQRRHHNALPGQRRLHVLSGRSTGGRGRLGAVANLV